ncbi:RsmB/NOP family class I SAM-dependent RNA methyltransferase [Desulfurococcaceae archaeon MEX13E-LK6-19]|nr:RsmB/NOP family class I SAM-dependent RNA methyltransferase [Desulfurococcaceae archaeon MEX13E-LK6-19]
MPGKNDKPRVKLSKEMLFALVEAIRWSERIKPSQHAKREAFKKYGVTSHACEPMLTAIFYAVMKKMGVLDKIIEDVTGVKPVYVLDPWLRAALRLATEILVYRKPTDGTRRLLKKSIAEFIGRKSHPYIGMFYYKVLDSIENYEFKPIDKTEEYEFKYMLPRWYIEKIIELVGEEEAKKIFSAFDKPLPISVRVNTLKTNVMKVIEELTRDVEWVEQSSVVETVLRFPGPYDFEKSRLWRKGHIIIQEEAAAVASIILDPKPGEYVVDLAAAPGGKTEHMAELMRNKGIIHAFDIDDLRIKRMRDLLERTGITIVEIHKIDAREAPEILGKEVADKVLLDAPCTSDGTIMKNPDLRWRIRPEGVEEFSRLQYELLEAGWKLLKPGGRLLYCTCSLLREENENIIEKFLNEHKDAKLVPLNKPYSPGFLPGTMRAWPHKHKTIGFFYALLEKQEHM